MALSNLTIVWLIVSAVIVLLDAAFVFTRPASLPGPKSLARVFPPFYAWHTYIQHDKRYAIMTDSWVLIQSYLNCFEAALQLIAVSFASHKLVVFTQTCTLYKTVIYVGLEALDGFKYTKHNKHSIDVFFVVILPLMIWIVVPLVLVCQSLNIINNIKKNGKRLPAVMAADLVKKET